jgi:hypothetical protein
MVVECANLDRGRRFVRENLNAFIVLASSMDQRSVCTYAVHADSDELMGAVAVENVV